MISISLEDELISVSCNRIFNCVFLEVLLTCCKNFQEEDNAEAAGMEDDGDDDMPDLESLNYDDLDSVSKLQKTQRYNDIMQVRKNCPQFLEQAFHFYIYLACDLFSFQTYILH